MNEYDDIYERFDVAECLTSEKAIAEYLRISMKEDNAEDFAEAVADAARASARLRKNKGPAPTVADWFRSLGLKFSLTPIRRSAAAVAAAA